MAAIAALIVVMALMSGRRTSEVELHMDSYNPAAGPNAKKGGIFEGFLEGFNKSLTRNKGGRTSRLTEELAKADLKLRVSEYVVLIIGLIVLLCAVLFLRFHNPVLALAGIPAGYFVPGFFLKFRQRRRLKAFNNQLGDTIVLLSNALKAGYSFAQAMATIAKSSSPPMADEFSRAVREMNLGVSVDDALQHMVKRIESEDFDLMVTAVQIHRVVGGNLAEILDTIAFTFLAFSGVFIAIQAVTAKPRQDLIAERLAQYRDHNLTLDEIELSLPFSERFIKPALERLGSVLTSRMAKNRQVVLQNKINLAGRPYALSVNGFEVFKVIAGIIVALLGFWIGGLLFSTSFPLRVGAAGLGFLVGRYLPDVWLNNKIKGRQKELRLALPNALDLLTISVEAGLGFDAAIGRLTEQFKNALSDEFAQVLNEIRLGRPRLEALDDMGRRSGVEELHTFIQALIQSEQLGVGIAKVLRIQSEEMRRRRRQRAEEQAAQAPLKMLFPMIGCIFPTLFIVLMGPAVIIIIHTFQHK